MYRKECKNETQKRERRLFQRRNRLYRQNVGHFWKAREAPGYVVVSFYRVGYLHRLMSGRSISAILGKS